MVSQNAVSVICVTVASVLVPLTCWDCTRMSGHKLMSLHALSGAATIALASSFIFLVVAGSWQALSSALGGRTRFPDSIMLEAAQRFRDDLEQLTRQQSIFLSGALVFLVMFATAALFRPEEIFGQLPAWQTVLLFIVLLLASGYGAYRLVTVTHRRRQLLFIRDASIAIGHGLQKLTMNQNRVFHDVPCRGMVLDNVIVGPHGIFAVYVIARRPGKDNRVRLSGDTLYFAPGKFALHLKEFGRKSECFARECRKLLQQAVTVRSVIAVPGWEVDAQASDNYLVLNERHLSIIGGWKDPNEYLLDEDSEAIQALLTARCTRFGSAN
jgi:hypothetical protein